MVWKGHWDRGFLPAKPRSSFFIQPETRLAVIFVLFHPRGRLFGTRRYIVRAQSWLSVEKFTDENGVGRLEGCANFLINLATYTV